jgi:hypothetical protein
MRVAPQQPLWTTASAETGVGEATLLQLLKLFAGLEANRLAWRDRHLRACTRVSSNPGLSGTNVEDAEAAKFYTLALRQRVLHAFENSLDSHLRFGFRDACPVDDFIDDVELDQCLPPKVTDRPSSRIWGTTSS